MTANLSPGRSAVMLINLRRFDTPAFNEIVGGSSPFNVISSAHQPSIGFLPYIVTGDYFYLEEMQFWSSYNQIWTSLGQRGGTQGYFYDQSLRGQAFTTFDAASR